MILVVGGSSKVCQLMVPHWIKENLDITLQYRQELRCKHPLPTLRWLLDDDLGPILRWASGSSAKPKTMIVLAGTTHHSGGDFNLNTKLADTCCRAAATAGIKRVLVASSAAVYGNQLQRAFTETDVPHPVSDYGVSKLHMEEACLKWSSELEVVCLRVGNVVGADALLTSLATPKQFELQIDSFDDGSTPERSYIGPKTMALALNELIAIPGELPPILNFAAPEPVQMGDLASAANIKWVKRKSYDESNKSITMDCSRLWHLLPNVSKTSSPSDMIKQIT